MVIFFQEGMYIHTLEDYAASFEKTKTHLSKHMDAKSVPLILFCTIWHSEFLEDE